MDLTFALRLFRKNPGFTALAVAVMALGIGANTAVFSVVKAVLLEPLAYREPDRLVTVAYLFDKQTSRYVSGPDFHDWHDQSTAFEAMAYYANGETAATVGGAAEYVGGAAVTPEFFRVFAVEPVLGRLFTAQENFAGPVVIGHAFWKSHFGGSAKALGKTIRMFGSTLTVVGVLPAGFRFPDKTDVWMPVTQEVTERSASNYRVIGRLKREASLEQAQAQMAAIGERLARQYPASNKGKGVAVTRMRDEMVREVRLTLYLLLGAVALVLLIACANVANLLLAKATARTREIATRAALGASRGRIARQLIVESLLVALAAGAGGVLLAIWGADALVAVAPRDVPRLEQTSIDGWVLAFTLGVSLLSTLLFGVAPALAASRVELSEALKQGSGRVAGGKAGRLRGALVVAEMALSVVLLAGAGLLVRSFVALHNVALGFRPESVLVMEASVPAGDLEGVRRASRFYRDLLADIGTLPGVTAAGAARTPPGEIGSWGAYRIDNQPANVTLSAPQAVFSVVAPGTFAALGIPLDRGRDFGGSDTYDSPFTAVINRTLARRAFEGRDPLGHLIYCGLDSPKAMKIVGVVGDVRQRGPAQPPDAEIFMPNSQHPLFASAMSVVVRTAAEPGAMAGTLRSLVRRHSPDVPVKFTTMEAALAENTAAPRFRTLLLGIFAALAVCLAMAGVYGVMAYAVSQRTNEIGVRMALGATAGDVRRLVLRQALRLAGAGLALGLAGAVAVTRLMRSLLFEVRPGDPATYAVVALLLGAAAAAASYLPAWRATKVDPLVALRQE